MRRRYAVLAFSIVCAAAVLLYLQPNIQAKNAAALAPYTAHLTITKNRVLPDGSTWNTVSTDVVARDRQGRTYDKIGHVFKDGGQRTESFSVFVQEPAKLQTLTWDSKGQVAVLAHWPYWSGRDGCWADEHGQHQSRLPSDDDWYKLPVSPGDGKLETIASMAVSADRRVKARVVTENLGHKEIHGLAAFGMRTTMTPIESVGTSDLQAHTTELWKSSELNLKLLQVTSGPKHDLTRLELSDLQRGDPDPSLFKPPQGYKVETIEYHQVPCEQQ